MNLWMWYAIIGCAMAVWRYKTTHRTEDAATFGTAWPFGILCLIVSWFIDRSNDKKMIQELSVVVFKKNRKVHYCDTTIKGMEEFWMSEPMCKTKSKEAQFSNHINQVTCKRCLTLLRKQNVTNNFRTVDE